MTEDEEADEIIKRLKAPPAPKRGRLVSPGVYVSVVDISIYIPTTTATVSIVCSNDL